MGKDSEMSEEFFNKARKIARDIDRGTYTKESIYTEYIAQLEKGLESSIAMNRAQADRIAELEARLKQEFDYAEKLLKERNDGNH
jgi:uncharacterized protein YciW